MFQTHIIYTAINSHNQTQIKRFLLHFKHFHVLHFAKAATNTAKTLIPKNLYVTVKSNRKALHLNGLNVLHTENDKDIEIGQPF